ncbi:TPA: hypothetical protein H1005_02240 [archaeon]|uniref:Uncharacterized protein n=1 Tax=Candidatus Naiadarchaeum limnaeum TaxID=2756139 RepID=A0A832UNK3_9ARCH|nr:hypothetical protein [Candidatus Naiadarchaeales archaeon SRR2090153.bin1042]HIK00479.1 hypothetical protein [Candidatus Naiadarchaeum limnaeum]
MQFFLKFKDYGWLARFFGECFEYLYKHGEIKFVERERSERKLPRGLWSLSRYLTKKLSYSEIGLRINIAKKQGVSLLIITFLIKSCARSYDEVQGQVDDMYARFKRSRGVVIENFGMKTIYIFHKSEKALAPHEFARLLKSEFADDISTSHADANLYALFRGDYLLKHDRIGAPYYTLRGEEYKFRG